MIFVTITYRVCFITDVKIAEELTLILLTHFFGNVAFIYRNIRIAYLNNFGLFLINYPYVQSCLHLVICNTWAWIKVAGARINLIPNFRASSVRTDCFILFILSHTAFFAMGAQPRYGFRSICTTRCTAASFFCITPNYKHFFGIFE